MPASDMDDGLGNASSNCLAASLVCVGTNEKGCMLWIALRKW